MNKPEVYFWIIFLALTFMVGFCDKKYCMLKDISKAESQPYSWSRVQLAWWTVIVLSSFITILIHSGSAPELNQSTVILLGISAATIATARVIDVSDINDPTITARSQDTQSANFFLDILSDQNGVSIYRFQTVIFNLVFGIWFITTVLNNINADSSIVCAGLSGSDLIACTACTRDFIMPVIGNNNLILLGLSSATYAALKTTENKINPTSGSGAANNTNNNGHPLLVTDESFLSSAPAQG